MHHDTLHELEEERRLLERSRKDYELLQKERDAWQDRYADVERKHQQSIEALQQEHQQTVETIMQKHGEETVQLRKKHEQNEEASKKECMRQTRENEIAHLRNLALAEADHDRRSELAQAEHRVVLKEAWDRHGELVVLSEANDKKARQQVESLQRQVELQTASRDMAQQRANILESQLQELKDQLVTKEAAIETLSARHEDLQRAVDDKDIEQEDLRRKLSIAQVTVEAARASQQAAEAALVGIQLHDNHEEASRCVEIDDMRSEVAALTALLESQRRTSLSEARDEQPGDASEAAGGSAVYADPHAVPRVGSRVRASGQGEGEVRAIELVLCDVRKKCGVSHLLEVSFDTGEVDHDFLWPSPDAVLLKY